MRVRGLIKQAARRAGYQIGPRGDIGRTMGDALNDLLRQGFEPATVLDIGVADGTSDLYRVFPHARFLLVEPLAEYEPALQAITKRLASATYVLAAVGRTPGTATIRVRGVHSSALPETDQSDVTAAERVVPVTTIDALFAKHHLAGPTLLKLDIQGAELEALAGATQTLAVSEVIVLEVSLLRIFEGGPVLVEVINQMDAYGFSVYDLFGGFRRLFDSALAQIDLVFVKTEGAFRHYQGFRAAQ